MKQSCVSAFARAARSFALAAVALGFGAGSLLAQGSTGKIEVTPLVVESLEHAASLQRWCVMVQREVADRFFAQPRTKAYGAVSVLVQLSARKTGFHSVPPTVFRPRPRVDSALVALERVAAASPIAAVRPVVEAAFAHRRKTLANSVAISGLAPRARAEEALLAIDRSTRVRAEELAPEEFVELAEHIR